ncbi:MAG: Jag N-terminal domain-containing protein [Acidobacteriota bacterium]|nr:Jag N-terminal domain-containing protein [Acidobacteriota bacterium]
MRFEGKSEQEAIETALRELKKPASSLRYSIVRDEKSFWGGRVVEIEVEVGEEFGARPDAPAAAPVPQERTSSPPPPPARPAMALASAPTPSPAPSGRAPSVAGRAAEPDGERGRSGPAGPGAMDDEAFTIVEATLTELLSAAGFLVETRRRPGEEMLFELIGDDTEPLLANRGEGLNGLEVLTGRIGSKRLGRPVYPRLDAEGFRAHQRESLEELALRSANEAKRTRSPQLLPPLSPGERRLIHLALAADPEVETESEGDGFLKRVAVRPKAS